MNLQFSLGAAFGLALCLSSPAGAESAHDCGDHGAPLRAHRVVSTDLLSLGDPGTTGDTDFVGYVEETSHPGIRVQFGYIQPKNPGALQDPQTGGRHECIPFHFKPEVPEGGGKFGVKTDGGTATVSIWLVGPH